MHEYPSIFNDVLGPIMVGPSSSHTVASVRIGKSLSQMVNGKITYFQADFDPDGSLAASYIGQCSDVGLIAGLLGMEPTNKELLDAIRIAEDQGMAIDFRIVSYDATHPNTYKMIIKSDLDENVTATALSVGGGMIEFIEINGAKVSIKGGFYETLIFAENRSLVKKELIKLIESSVSDFCSVSIQEMNDQQVISIQTHTIIKTDELEVLKKHVAAENVIAFDPVLPIMSQKKPDIPFQTVEEMLEIAKNEDLDLADMALTYESIRGHIDKKEVYDKAVEIVDIMSQGIELGLKGTNYADRILGYQSHKMFVLNDKLIGGDITLRIIGYISAMMEVKSSMNVFVAAPTAGSCGTLPGTVLAVSSFYDKSKDEVVRAFLAAGMIGVFIAEYATFAAEVAGCQAECGAGSGMTAGALVQLMGGTIEEAVDAASMALQNIFGMVCDPIAMRVEVPCLGKNVMCGLNALGGANMALAGYDAVIPLDETIESFNKVGRMIPPELRCTGLAGIAQTKTGLKLADRLGCSLGCC
ncbi:L-serine ammonia-lyase, iron-sulfur-dependent, subunit alpha [Vagococcus sp. BWB3-3]|uniref:L-serine ammonia-lyase n=1 Tax=Vagococcus allomyrinae TaxID=2794353 RepID=A0A940P968_9ENTE|nr:L-serine ammonia-lyase, iron-sulfur-dependent, subunit alpha [Vagococcus allomyrinae]MBP1040764.1 L-serine ammonia-lyase, iron-sulfur-dependent, subunit alpha [Vagococcus allomyrinae]